ncbi:MAG TPA: hypothetical protein VLV76_23000 [Candidatus Acidoferrum sp.]|nr:hypothetical protein [Candidatus Acidoferrum sp.]
MHRNLALVSFALVAAIASQAAIAQERPEIGRFQVVIPIYGDATALLIDTVTGRSWILSGKKSRTWSDLNYGEAKGGHVMLTPAPCTKDNPTCYFEMPKPETAAGEAVH